MIDTLTGSQRPLIAYAVALIVLTVLAYRLSFQGDFVFDDSLCIERNFNLHRWFPTVEQTPLGLTGRPVGRISFTLNYWISGREPWSYHLVNLLIHIGGGLLLFDLTRRTLMRPGLAERYAKPAAGIAFAVAAIWLVHPLQTQAVTYIVQRLESLCAMFYLATLYFLLRSAEGRWKWGWGLLAVACCWLGQGTKEVTVTAPLAALLFDRIYLANSWREVWSKRWPLHVALICSMAIPFSSLVSTSSAGDGRGIAFGSETLSTWQYLSSQPGVLLHYIRLAFWPARLCLDYLWPVADSPLEIYPPGLVILALLATSLALLYYRPRLGFVAFMFFLVLSPTSSVIPIVDLAFEHRMYLPLASLVILVVLAGYHLFHALQQRDPKLRYAPVVVLALILMGLVFRTSIRNRDYSSPILMWQSVLDGSPDNARALSSLGRHLRGIKRFEEAERHLNRSMEIAPYFSMTHEELGILYAQRGEHERAEPYFLRAIELAPEVPHAHQQYAISLAAQGRTEEAAKQYERAIELEPLDANSHLNYGNLLARNKQFSAAIKKYRQALACDPKLHEARRYLAMAAYDAGDNQLSLNTWQEISLRDPQSAEARTRIAWILATASQDSLRNGQQALAIANELVREGLRQDPYVLDALAAAQAEVGEFDKAQQTARDALEQLPANASKRLAAQIQKRISLYEAERPARYPEPADSQES